MACDYTALYPDTSNNGAFTKSWNYTTAVDTVASCSAAGFFNVVSTRLGIGDNIQVAVVDALDKTRTTLIGTVTLYVSGISGGVVTTTIGTGFAPTASPSFTGTPTAPTAAPGNNSLQIATTAYADAIAALLNAALALKATLASPTFTGVPAVPTAAPGNNTTQIASTAYVDASAALQANLASPAFTGTPTAPTAAPATNSTQLATTAYADAINTAITTALALKANLASPTLTGTPLAPTPAGGDNSTKIATTAYMQGQGSNGVPAVDSGAGTSGVGLSWTRSDHVHPTDTSRQAADPQLFSNIPQNSKSAAYTTVLTDGEKHILHPAADTTARIFTIDSNANVAYPIGTAITFINQNAGGVVTISITSDTLRLAGAGTTGSRTLAANGIATAVKIVATEWIISGVGLT